MNVALRVKLLAATSFLLAGAACGPLPSSVGAPGIGARLALLADPHVSCATNGNNAAFRARFEQAIAQVNAAGVDFVLIAGDLTQSGRPEEFAEFKAQLQKLRAPVMFVPGNHDVGHKFNSGETNDTVTPARVAAYEKAMGRSWFTKTCAGVRIIGINSSLLGSGFEPEARMWKFLECELERPSGKPAIVFMHYPLFLKDAEEASGGYYNTEAGPRSHMLELLRRGHVKTVLSGHVHRAILNRQNGTLFVTAPPISFGLPRGKTREGWTLVTIAPNGDAESELRTLD